ncbi:MAG: thermonuclease family protein [Pseudomonadota bacterium]
MAIWRFFGLVVSALALVSCGQSNRLEDFQAGETGRVVRVIDGDALVLDTGQSVRLVGVEAPSFGRDGRADQPFARESHRILEDLVLGRQVQLQYAGLTRDRYDRALAHVTTIDRLGPRYWVNLELVSMGAGRVRTYPDTARGSLPLFEAERDARQAQSGLWSLRAYSIADARDVETIDIGFTILTGILGPREAPPFDDTACARDLLGSSVTVVVELAAMRACDLEAGLKVEVRGWYRSGRLNLNSAENLQSQGRAAIASRDPIR